MADQPWNFFGGAISGDNSPDYFLPEVFTLSSGTVQGIETSPTDPKVRFDSTGLYATDAAGNKVAQLNADGTGTFAGHISGQRGVDIIAAGAATAPSDNRVRWIRQADGSVVADILGYEDVNAIHLGLKSYPVAGKSADAYIGVGGGPAGIIRAGAGGFRKAAGPTFNSASAFAYDDADSVLFQRDIIRGDGGSDFLQVGQSGKFRFTTGLANVSWPGGVVMSNNLVVTHNLGVIPLTVVATMQTSGQGQVIACHAGNYTATTFTVQAQFVQGFVPSAGTIPVTWIAIANQ